MKTKFGYTYQKLQQGGTLFEDKNKEVEKLIKALKRVLKGQLPPSSKVDGKQLLSIIMQRLKQLGVSSEQVEEMLKKETYEDNEEYQEGGIIGRKKISRTTKIPSGRIIETYEDTRFDSQKPNEYTFNKMPQSKNTINRNNALVDEYDLSNINDASYFANNLESIGRKNAQIGTQALMNKLAKEAVMKGELIPGKSIKKGGFTLTMDYDGNVKGDRALLNEKIGLNKDLEYNVGKYYSDLEYEGKEKPQGVTFGSAKLLFDDVIINSSNGQFTLQGIRELNVSFDENGNIKISPNTGKTNKAIPTIKAGIAEINLPNVRDWRDVKYSDLDRELVNSAATKQAVMRFIKQKTAADMKTNEELGYPTKNF